MRIERLEAGTWSVAAFDDDPEVEVWSIDKVKQGWRYEVRWVPGQLRGPFRLQVMGRDGAPLGAASAACNREKP